MIRTSAPPIRRFAAGMIVTLGFLAFHASLLAVPPYRNDRILLQPKAEAAREHLARSHGDARTDVMREFKNMGGLQVVRVPPVMTVEAVLEHFRKSGLFEFAEPDYYVYPALVPNDPYYQMGYLWQFENFGQEGGTVDADIDAPEAWNIQHTATNVVVAIIDTGIRATHQDLASNLWINPGEVPGNGLDDDTNGVIDDVNGFNAVLNSGNVADKHGHGTMVSGVLGAVGNNGAGVAGVAWSVNLMMCRYVDDYGNGGVSDVIQCFDYARNQGAHLINASLVLTEYSAAFYSAIRSCRSEGIIVVAAAGNSTNNNDQVAYYPASFNLDNIVAVAATTRTDDLADYSNYGAQTVDLGAPGTYVFAPYIGSDTDYVPGAGTSYATPMVAGALALVKSRYPTENYRQLINRVLSAVDPIPALAGKCVTGGRLNLAKALGAGILKVTPAAGLASSGHAGGPFIPPTHVYQLTNSGAQPLDWTAHVTTSWISLSSTNGTLAPAASTGVTVAINAQADALGAGTHVASMTFSNATAATVLQRSISLTVYELPRLSLPTYGTTNGFRAQFHGIPSWWYIIEGTTNFLNWIPVSTNQAPTTGAILFQDPTAFPHRFFRARSASRTP